MGLRIRQHLSLCLPQQPGTAAKCWLNWSTYFGPLYIFEWSYLSMLIFLSQVAATAS